METKQQDANLEATIKYYYSLMQKRDSRFCWRNKNWWQDDQHATVLTVQSDEGVDGFLILGSGPYADSDVSSEICEVFSRGGLRTLGPLVRRVLPQLHPPWGFQVMKTNQRAVRVFEWFLKRHGLVWISFDSKEDGIEVTKYRITPERTHVEARVQTV